MPTPKRPTAVLFFSFLAIALCAPPLAAAGKAEKEAVAKFRAAMKQKGERERIQAVNRLAAVDGKSISRELRKVVGQRGADRVSAAAARALGRRGEKSDLGYLVRMIRPLKKRPYALAGVVDGIGEYGEPKTAQALFDVARSYMLKHKLPAQAAVRALGKVRTKQSVDLLVKLYGLTFPGSGFLRGPDPDLTIPGPTSDATRARLEDFQPYIEASLRRLTGETINKYDVWKEWWAENRAEFDFQKVKIDLNRTFTLTDDQFGYAITRPGDEWLWLDKPQSGFQRTARMGKEGDATASLSILVYSVLERTPEKPSGVLDEARKDLTARFDTIESRVWGEKTELGGVEAEQHRVKGKVDGEGIEIRYVACLHDQKMYIIEVTVDGWASRREKKSAEEFLESFVFLK